MPLREETTRTSANSGQPCAALAKLVSSYTRYRQKGDEKLIEGNTRTIEGESGVFEVRVATAKPL